MKREFPLIYCLDLENGIGESIKEVYRWEILDSFTDLLDTGGKVDDLLEKDDRYLVNLDEAVRRHLSDEGFALIDKSIDILPYVAECLWDLFNRRYPELLEYEITVRFYDSLNDAGSCENETLVYSYKVD